MHITFIYEKEILYTKKGRNRMSVGYYKNSHLNKYQSKK